MQRSLALSRWFFLEDVLYVLLSSCLFVQGTQALVNPRFECSGGFFATPSYVCLHASKAECWKELLNKLAKIILQVLANVQLRSIRGRVTLSSCSSRGR